METQMPLGNFSLDDRNTQLNQTQLGKGNMNDSIVREYKGKVKATQWWLLLSH